MPASLRRLFVLTAIALAPSLPAGAQEDPPADAGFEERVRTYLLQHPEVIIEALQEYDRRQKADAEQRQKQAIVEHRDDLIAAPGDPVAGNSAGAVTVVEFFDYRCPYCKAVARDMIATLQAEGDVRIVFKEFPILGPDSQMAAKAALAADKQGKYLAFHQALMDHKGVLDRDALEDIAEDTGLDVELLLIDMDSAEVETVIARNMALADTLEIGGTPAFIIGDTLVPGALDMKTLKELVAKARSG